MKISSSTPEYNQFVQIYQLVPIPSLFFINQAGSPIEVATSILKTADEFQQMVDRVVKVSDEGKVEVPQNLGTGSEVAGNSAGLTEEETLRIEALKADRFKRAQALIEKTKLEKAAEEAKVIEYF